MEANKRPTEQELKRMLEALYRVAGNHDRLKQPLTPTERDGVVEFRDKHGNLVAAMDREVLREADEYLRNAKQGKQESS